MQVTYRHYYGAQENFDLACFTAELTCDEHEESTALSQGWLQHDGRWYQSRSTRIRCAAYERKAAAHDQTVHYSTSRENVNVYAGIYAAWCDAKGYRKHYDPFKPSDRDIWMEYRRGSLLIGFTKLLRYQGGLESQFNAYIPDSGSMHGSAMLDAEVAFAIDQDLEFLYIGSGYEHSSIYKAHINGFQWWTGAEWSEDNSAYIRLCERVGDIRDMVDLARIASQA